MPSFLDPQHRERRQDRRPSGTPCDGSDASATLSLGHGPVTDTEPTNERNECVGQVPNECVGQVRSE